MPQLTAVKVKSATKPSKYGDGAGLYLNAASGSKSWVQCIVVDGRRRDIGAHGSELA